MPDKADLLDLESSMSEVAHTLFSPASVEGTLQRVVDLACETIDGCDGAGVLVVRAAGVSTVASTSEWVLELDRQQIDAVHGPGLTAATEGHTVYVPDLSADQRWSGFASPAQEAGVRSVLVYSLSVERPSALSIYSRLPAAFGAIDRVKGQVFAVLAGLALDHAEARVEGERRADNLIAALRTRELIGQAQGILMEREGITAEQAFVVLRRASQQLNVKLREVASRLVETGESPDQ